tara:strand:- start:4010 stop:4381 length:372 start_codon:yes stop_codon:yes gene_type:complete
MKKETRAFIDELIRQKQWQKDNGPIELTADQMWKYSGKTEEITYAFDINNPKHYKHREIKDTIIYNTLSPTDNLIIESYFKNPNRTMDEVAESLNRSETYIRKVISKYFEIKRHENIDNERSK